MSGNLVFLILSDVEGATCYLLSTNAYFRFRQPGKDIVT